jgi:putative membrane protein
MFVRRRIPWTWTLYYAWPSLLYFLLLAIAVYWWRRSVEKAELVIPFEPVTILATALAIFLGFKNNEAYSRWWEARTIWGLAVNNSRAWARQVLSLFHAPADEAAELRLFQRRLVYRHLAFINALRVYLRSTASFPLEVTDGEPGEAHNHYSECRQYLDAAEFARMARADNPPDALLQMQGQDLHAGWERGWLNDYVLVQLDTTLVALNHVQGASERIKKTPLPRPYSYFTRVIVHVHGTLLPFAFVDAVGWTMIPLSFIVSFVFLALDLIGSRTEDPFENRVDDVPLSSLTRTIERNLEEALGEKELPPAREPELGVLF